ncbi:hypothetical protein EI94DRAFT_1105078 [Lactarius quietus]|nr:hypothetical protein EI94DRAFT_1105078 [Lactarius quietus]
MSRSIALLFRYSIVGPRSNCAGSPSQFMTQKSVDRQLELLCPFSRKSLRATPLLVGIRRSRHNNLQWHVTIMEGLTPQVVHRAVVTGASSERERGLRKLAHLYYPKRRLDVRRLCSKRFCLSSTCQLRSLYWGYGVTRRWRLPTYSTGNTTIQLEACISNPNRQQDAARLVIPFLLTLSWPFGNTTWVRCLWNWVDALHCDGWPVDSSIIKRLGQCVFRSLGALFPNSRLDGGLYFFLQTKPLAIDIFPLAVISVTRLCPYVFILNSLPDMDTS